MKTRILLYLIVCFTNLHLFATETSETHDAPLITNIKYDYSIIDSDKYGKDCVGTLSFQLGPQKDVDHYTVARDATNSRWNHAHGFMLLKSWCDIDDNHVCNFTRNEIYWDIYFQVTVTYKDGTQMSSKKLNTNDFIAADDLNILKTSSAMEDGFTNFKPEFTFNANSLIVKCKESISIRVADISGRELFHGKINDRERIDISKSTSNLLIIKCSNINGHSFIQKLFKP